ncbi:10549_t:CDS:2 [Funneliformis mosseae]|uniref:10549_t:CDS:1 n=1 Tax=Funneliformis mosseae TaxID=27381 RepID=A0A9N8Z7D5_FUNMO|nr:10549_t:CDS:2 [Funneliformis mosseae]
MIITLFLIKDGGMMSDNSSCSLSEVYLYDTINDQWDTKV